MGWSACSSPALPHHNMAPPQYSSDHANRCSCGRAPCWCLGWWVLGGTLDGAPHTRGAQAVLYFRTLGGRVAKELRASTLQPELTRRRCRSLDGPSQASAVASLCLNLLICKRSRMMAPSLCGCGEGVLNEGIIIKGTGSMPREGFAKSHLLTTFLAHGRSPSICWPPSGLWQALSHQFREVLSDPVSIFLRERGGSQALEEARGRPWLGLWSLPPAPPGPRQRWSEARPCGSFPGLAFSRVGAGLSRLPLTRRKRSDRQGMHS